MGAVEQPARQAAQIDVVGLVGALVLATALCWNSILMVVLSLRPGGSPPLWLFVLQLVLLNVWSAWLAICMGRKPAAGGLTRRCATPG